MGRYRRPGHRRYMRCFVVLKQETFLILAGFRGRSRQLADSGQDRDPMARPPSIPASPLHHQMQHKGLAETKVVIGCGSRPAYWC
jgi:hypothetical protein